MSTTERTSDEVGVGWPVTVGETLPPAEATVTMPGVEGDVGWGDR
ncbi:unannotated protein [freshwater metagenome]|uniref:Unannotated protein n=1 Tax=freshwater metagenome TaxID=449393 RepID=A0A6J7RGD9_9ZZZZ